MAADALDLHEVAGTKVRHPSDVERHHSGFLDEPGQHFIERARDAHDVPAVEPDHCFIPGGTV